MGYSISLLDPVTRAVIELDEVHDMRGGTYQVGGTREAWLSVTYNYSDCYRRVLGEKGIQTIYGMTGAAALPVLDDAIGKLGDETDPNYWKSTDGNAKQALRYLRKMAEMRPDGIFDGD